MTVFYEKLLDLLRSRQGAAVATIIGTKGSSPRGVGAKMIVTSAGETYFSVGGGSLEELVKRESLKAMKEGRSVVVDYNLEERGETAAGMLCGGKCSIFIEVLKVPERLIIFGCGHVGKHLAGMAGDVGFEVTLVDDREGMTGGDDWPPGAAFVRTDPAYRENLPSIDGGTYIVIVTRSHESDEAVLKAVAGSEAAYVGMIGSRKKAKTILERLARSGIDPEWIGRVRSPIGLEIQAETPGEIAVSILAQLINVKRGGGN